MLRNISKALLIGFFALATAAWASPLDDAKAAGQLGEQPDGFVGIVVAAPSQAIQDLAKDINRKRNKHYAKIAKQTGTSKGVVASQAGGKLLAKAESGHFVRNAKGKWVKKP